MESTKTTECKNGVNGQWEQRKMGENNTRCTSESESEKQTNDNQNADRKR